MSFSKLPTDYTDMTGQTISTRSPVAAASAFLLSLVLLGSASAQGAAAGSKDAAKKASLLRKAQSLESRGKWRAAAKRYRKAEKYAAEDRERADFVFRRGECFFRAEQPYPAYEAYKQALASYPMFVPFEQVIDRLRGLAEQFAEGRGAPLGLSNRGIAIEVYELILKKAPAGKKAPADALRLGQLQAETKQSELAVLTYRDLIKRHPLSEQAATARVEIAELLLELSQEGDGDGRLVRQARRELETVLAKAPKDERREEAEALLSKADERQADALCGLGEFYLRDSHQRLSAARRYLHDVVREYPSTKSATMAKALLQQVAILQEAEPAKPAPAATPAPVPEPSPGVAPPKPAEKTVVRPPAKEMTPDKLRKRSPDKPLRAQEGAGKWLLPLEDFQK